MTPSGIEVATTDGVPVHPQGRAVARRVEQRPDRFAIGEKLDAKVTNIDECQPTRHAVDQGARDRDEKAGHGGWLVGQRRQPGRHPRSGDQGAPGAAGAEPGLSGLPSGGIGAGESLTSSEGIGTVGAPRSGPVAGGDGASWVETPAMTKSDLIKRLAGANPHLYLRHRAHRLDRVRRGGRGPGRGDRVELRGFGAFSVRQRNSGSVATRAPATRSRCPKGRALLQDGKDLRQRSTSKSDPHLRIVPSSCDRQ